MKNKIKAQSSKLKITDQNSKLKILDEILKKTREDVEERKKLISFSYSSSEVVSDRAELRSNSSRRTSFARTITDAAKYKKVAIIAEIKFASPGTSLRLALSANPNLGSASELLDRARAYEKAGADAISVITEKHFFKGDIRFVSEVKKVVKLPVLQKDFVIDEQQIYEAKMVGSDALLFIARLVSEEKLKTFVLLAQKLGIEPVVEVFDEKDLEKAVTTKTRIIAVNARDLRDTFTVDINKACSLMKKIPEGFMRLGFSGIQSSVEVKKYANAGAQGVLVGTSLMKAKNIGEFIGGLR